MKKNNFWNLFTDNTEKVILLEGARLIKLEEHSQLKNIGSCLRQSLSQCVFRSGNAIGSDAAFTTGVMEIASTRIEIIVPYSTHRLKEIPHNAKVLSLSELDSYELSEIKKISCKANPDRAQLVKLYSPVSKSTLSIKASYLLRDVLKLTGLPSSNFKPTFVAIFHTKPQTVTGGTFHTMKVCKYLGIPQFHSKDFFIGSSENGVITD